MIRINVRIIIIRLTISIIIGHHPQPRLRLVVLVHLVIVGYRLLFLDQQTHLRFVRVMNLYSLHSYHHCCCWLLIVRQQAAFLYYILTYSASINCCCCCSGGIIISHRTNHHGSGCTTTTRLQQQQRP